MAEPISFDDLLTSYISSTPGSTIVKRRTWYDLAPDTRKGYNSAIKSFESFCMLMQRQVWPATTQLLEEWVAHCIFGSTLPKQSQIKPETAASYLSALKSYHIDRYLSLEAFNTPRIALIIKGSKRLFFKQKATRLPITKPILKEITKYEPIDLDELNIDTAFKVAWAEFLRLGEIIYTGTELKKAAFARTKVTRSDFFFAEGNQYAILRLKQSKTDIEHTGLQIVLAATGEKTCPVAALARLYTRDPQQPNAPLFRLASGAFSRYSIVPAFKKRISLADLPQSDYSGHSFRKGAVQHAANHGLLDEMIQKLGRWTSNAFRLYFTTSPESLYNLNLSFQKGMPLAVPRAVVPGKEGQKHSLEQIGHAG